MFHRDYFLRMVEETGQVLAKLVGFRRENRYIEARKLLQEVFSSFFPFPREQFRYLEGKDLLHFLVNNKSMNHHQLTVIADLLREEAEVFFGEGKWEEGKHCLRQGLDILISQHCRKRLIFLGKNG